MIVNTGIRTDIVRFYTPWLLKRFEEGFVYSRNPLFPNKVTRYELTPESVDCVVFCSKDYAPLLPHVRSIADRFSTYFYYTVTGYGAEIEPTTPAVEQSIETLRALSAVVGRKKVAWRYDPVLLTREYTPERHFENFEKLCREIAPYVDRCVFSFVATDEQILDRMPEMVPITPIDKQRLAKGLGQIAQKYGLCLQTCATGADYSAWGIRPSGCVTLDILGKANDVAFRRLKHRGLREGCRCIESRDIGAYDTCAGGCRYCSANRDPEKAQCNRLQHDPDSPLLIGSLQPTDFVVQGSQPSFRERVRSNRGW